MKYHFFFPKCLGRFVATLFISCTLVNFVFAGSPPPTPAEEEDNALADWWNGKYMTGNWFGVRDTLADHGLTFSGKYRGVFYGVLDSARGSRGFYDEELAFAAELDFAKLTGINFLEGLKGFGEVRWRDPRSSSDPNQFVEASSLFQPSHFQSGTQWRLLTFGLEYTTPELFGAKEFLTLRGGWIRPQKEFIDQPLSKLFINNSIESGKGVGGNIPFSSSFSTWGGTLKIKPVEWYYAKGGLFLAYPSPTSSSNHGLAFEGYGPDPRQNGLMAMFETGITPKIGPSELPGKYAIGAYYYGVDKKSFNGTQNQGQYGFYAQFDQMLFREPSPEEPAPLAKGPSDGKSFKSVVTTSKPQLSKQGLSMFNLISFAPKYNNLIPFYFQSGLVYTGLIPMRDKDLTMFALSFGTYSFYNIEALQAAGNVNQPNYTMVLEADYRFQINGWSFIQPMLQYIIKPNGTGNVENAFILGFAVGVDF